MASEPDPSSSAAAGRPIEPGEWIGPYHVLQLLGEGGMGAVYLCEQRQPVRRRVAIKVIKLGMDSKAVLARFEAERSALAMMEHSAIARVYDGGLTSSGRPWFAMEYVKGIPITDYCDQNRLPLEDRIALFKQVCAGVQHAHLKGVMHRDLKPSNVLVTLQDGEPTPKIIDFGLAKAVEHRLVEATVFTEMGQILGTPEYMSPEQAGLDGLDIDTRTDVYSLGVLLYHLLVGELPIPRHELLAHGYLEMQRVIREQDPPKPSTRITTLGAAATAHAHARRLDLRDLKRQLDGDLDWIVLKAMEKDRTRRYETALELAADLERFLRLEPVLAGPPSLRYRAGKFLRRHRAAVGTAIAATAGLAISLGLITKLYLRADGYLTTLDEVASGVEVASLVETAKRDLDAAWRPREHFRAPMAAWLAAAERAVARTDEHRENLLHFRERRRIDDRPGFALLEQHYQSLLRDLAVLGETAGPIEQVRRRLRDLDRVAGSDSRDELWSKTAAAMRADARYRGVDLAPQTGLVPLGPDPDSGLQEFGHLLSGAVPQRDGKGHLALSKDSCLVLVLIPGGTPVLGSQKDAADAANYCAAATDKEMPTYSVELAPFFLGKHEVTQAQWQRATGRSQAFWTNVRLNRDTDMHPMENVSALEMRAFLTAMDLELPTEAQWEYACRAGTTTPWFTGVDRGSLLGYANLADLSARAFDADWASLKELDNWPGCDDGWPITAPIGSFRANGFGLYDTAGNVFEMSSDTYVELSHKEQHEPGTGRVTSGFRSGETRTTYLGGSFRSDANELRAANRFSVDRGARLNTVGFRVARSLAATK